MSNLEHTTNPSPSDSELQAIAAKERLSLVKYLTPRDVETVVEIAMGAATNRGADFYGWKNAPEFVDGKFQHSSGWGDQQKTRAISPTEALAIYKEKLDGAYGERFLQTIATVAGLVSKGHRVALIQVQDEPGIPFDANGWVVVSINGYPLFHISPEDLPMTKVAEAGLVTVVAKNTPAAEEHGWKQTNKIDEYGLLLRWAAAPAMD